jgi:hypothetical protein
MKKILLFLYIITLFAGLSSCKKNLTDQFYNQDQLSDGVTDIVPGLFTQTITNNKIFANDYGEWWYLLSDGMGPAAYEQLIQRYVSTRYDWYSNYNDLVTGNGFEDFAITGQSFFEQSYERLKSWETIKAQVDQRGGQAKADATLYLKLLNVVKDCQVGKLVDFFNSVPYFNAFQGRTGNPDNYFPVYDDPQKVYEAIITDLGNMVDSLPGLYSAGSPTGLAVFKTQDAVFNGDISKWVQFANATRLKLLVRLAGVDPDFAKQGIADVLKKPLPTQDLYWHYWYQINPTGGGTWLRGMYEASYTTFIPNIIMKRLNYGTTAYEKGTDDPRLPVIAFPTKYKDYRGVSYNIDSQTVIYNNGDKYYPYADNIASSLAQDSKSKYNMATYTWNANMPVYMFSLGELDLLLAEIELKGLASTGKTAEEHIKDEVIHSTKFWYSINQMSTWSRGVLDSLLYPVQPSDADIAAWGDVIKTKFVNASTLDDKMEVLMQQKFIHLNLLEPYELWSELRRTGHPKMEPMTYNGVVMKPMPQRVRYPTSEQTNNAANFVKVANDNNDTSPIFWVPPAQRSIVPYWDNYNYQ